MAQVETLQSEIQGSVRNNKALLQGIQESFAINLEEMSKTVKSLSDRVNAIEK